jgi:hypothetical protein
MPAPLLSVAGAGCSTERLTLAVPELAELFFELVELVVG